MKKYLNYKNCVNLINMHDSSLLKGIDEAIKRIAKAVNEREKIVIYGSCDVDGIVSVSLLILMLKYLNADVEYYIPDSIYEDKIFNADVIENHIKLLGASLIITVGCGMNSFKEVELCKKLKIDTIITDCHKSNTLIPNTIVINPKQDECEYPFKELNAVGIAFKLASSVAEHYHVQCIEKYLDLVAIGIASSNVPLVGENKFMIEKGMVCLSNTNNYGINAITKINNIVTIDYAALTKLVNIVMPRVNAVGRMDDAKIAVELFTTTDYERAERIAKYINKTIEYDYKKINYKY
ncbi:DHH family phosphoesterase [Clostridium aestuarii]|uniref:DHH family phosphoesterase n=1 Tax=Clostridium aestuarii TaxID=338193 RepID=A0ABT4D0P4_9CLOT|nr:DHH family phosphoesterase [Clostridium aestuarii]MCY6483623.1 DHH family phosphoesterase [Clostridium aestuarii]